MANKDPKQQGSSLSAFLSTLIPVAVQAGAFVLIFLFLRSRLQRVYRPRTYHPSVPKPLRSEDLPTGRFNWLSPFLRQFSDEYALNHTSLDGYFYLRFFKVLGFICFVGCCITWPVLFPVNATAHGTGKQFDLLSFANIPKSGKNRYYAHVFIGWIFFSFVIFVLTREYVYCINLRNAYLTAPFRAARISSRTVLFTDVKEEYLSHDKLKELFGATIRRVWLSKDTSEELDDDVKQRTKVALKLENAEIKLLKTANKRRLKAEKKAAKGKTEKKPVPAEHQAEEAQNEKVAVAPDADPSSIPAAAGHNANDEETAQFRSEYLLDKDRPQHRLGLFKLPCLGRKVDTINWSRSELKTLNPKIEKTQASLLGSDGKVQPAVFIEFADQRAAQAAYRRLSLFRAPNMLPRAVSSTPDDIVWGNVKMTKYERTIRKLLTNSFLSVMIIFWAIPVAVVGAISNINYLTDKVHFLRFIDHIPPVILGVVTGLLPSVLLAVLMALVPIICRLMGKLRGEVTLSAVELYCQHWYMAFQVVQVFLITTFASGATSVVTQIISDPSSATTLLAENLPKASNFFISYIVVQLLGVAAGVLLNIGALAMLTIVGKFLDGTPRKMYTRYMTLAGLGWGSLYPVFGNLGIIALAYSIIAPLVLGFACIGFFLTYFAVRYNVFFTLTNNVDTKGLAYGRVIQQLMTGVYISEVCLLGLFAINTAPGPIVLMAVFIGFTAIYHAAMRNALKPHLTYLTSIEDDVPSFNFSDIGRYNSTEADGVPPSEWVPPAQSKLMATREKLYSRIFAPQKFASYQNSRSVVTEGLIPQYLPEEEAAAYLHPSLTDEAPQLWIARDPMGVSRRECRDTEEEAGISMTDEHAYFDEKNKIVWDLKEFDEDPSKAPVYEKDVLY